MPTAYWCVLFAGLLPVLTVGLAKAGGRLDNNNPRDWAGQLAGYRRRAHAAHLNHFEAFPLFAAAVIVAKSLGAPAGPVDALALTFVAARIAYTACYMLDWATLRSVVWLVGWMATIAIFASPVWA